MKNKKKKILISILIIFILLFLLGAKSYAFGLDDAIDGIVGILLLPAKFIVLILGGVIEIVMGFFTNSDGIGLTLEDILFNDVPLLDINFFDFTIENETALIIRENVAIWYTSIRNVAAVVLAVIAVYVGIRMAISTIAEDKAKYKTMLYDWLTSLALLFVLQYIMIFTIKINDAFINVLSTGLDESSFGDMTDTFFTESLKAISFTTGVGCAIIYVMLQAVTFVFFLTYLKRMITLAFLIVISPIVTITYSIDKMGDGRSQALNVWLKEYVYNILIQPFHCISYRVLGQTAISLMTSHGFAEGAGLANAVVAIMVILFIYSSEEIVKHIFHFENQSMGKTVANAAIGGVVLNKVMSQGKKASGGSSSKSKGFASSSKGSSSSNKSGNSGNPAITNTSSSGSNSSTTMTSSSGSNTSNTSSNGSNSSNSSTSSNESNSSSTSGKNTKGSVVKQKAKKVGKALGKAALSVTAKSPRVAGAMLLGGLGLGLGDPNTAFAGAMAGSSMGKSFEKANKTRIMKHDFARAVNKYKNENPNITADEVLNNGLHFLDGSIEPQTDAELELAKVMQRMEQSFIDNGADEKKVAKQFKGLISDVEAGRISEYSTFQRFRGNIKNKFTTKNNNSNNVNHNYGNNSNNNNNTNNNSSINNINSHININNTVDADMNNDRNNNVDNNSNRNNNVNNNSSNRNSNVDNNSGNRNSNVDNNSGNRNSNIDNNSGNRNSNVDNNSGNRNNNNSNSNSNSNRNNNTGNNRNNNNDSTTI